MPEPMVSVLAAPKPAKMLPPALTMLALPEEVFRATAPALSKPHWVLPLLTVMPGASVRPLSSRKVLPVVVRLLPMVPVSKKPVPKRFSAVPSLLTRVPPMMVPLVIELSPPLLKMPALPMSSVLPVLMSVPVRLTMLPAPRIKVPSVAVL